MPLIAQEVTLGVLSLVPGAPVESTSSEPETAGSPFTETKLRLVTAFAEHMGVALANLNLREMLRSQAIRDPLTNLYNRRFMIESLEGELKRSERKASGLGILMLDIDYFKQFNDNFGHEAGDLILHELGHYLLTHLREKDVSCRFGGEEFVLIFPETSLEEICRRAEELRKGIKGMDVTYQGRLLDKVSVSMGISLFPENGEDADTLLRSADQALYSAKARGRDRVAVAGLTVPHFPLSGNLALSPGDAGVGERDREIKI